MPKRDERGMVKVVVIREDENRKPVKGNRVDTFRIEDSTVTAVAEIIKGRFRFPEVGQIKERKTRQPRTTKGKKKRKATATPVIIKASAQ